MSERDVKADLAIWPTKFIAVGNDLPQVQAEVNRAAKAVAKFRVAQGFSADEYRIAELET